MEILILCQRKYTPGKEHYKVREVVSKIFKFVEDQYKDIDTTFNYTFLTNCFPDDPQECADVRMMFNMYNEKTQVWVNNNKKKFDVIILNTCPIMLFPIHGWYGFWELLVDGGRLYMTNITNQITTRDPNVMKLVFAKNKPNMHIVLIPIIPIVQEAINVIFSKMDNKYLIKKECKQEYKQECNNIYSYLLDEACRKESLEKLFPILPKNLQNFIFRLCNFIVKNPIVANKNLAINIINIYNSI